MIVPVIVIFTKFDALDDIAFQDLLEKGASESDAVAQCETHKMELFNKTRILDKLFGSRFPPKHTAFLQGESLLFLSFKVSISFHFRFE